ncbi:MAG: ribokinase [Rhizobiaceae bacterium]
MPQILVVGSLHYDIVVEAPHLPRRDETVIGSNVRFVCGGKGGNQAVAASRHGGDVAFTGAVGEDFFAEVLIANLHDAGVDVEHVVRTPEAASGISMAIVEETGDYGAVVASGANRLIKPQEVGVPHGITHLLLQNEIPECVNLAASRQVRDRDTQVILNAAPMLSMSDELLDCVDLLIVNRLEAQELFGAPQDTLEQATMLLENLSILTETVIVTLGGDGLVFRSGDAAPKAIPAHDVEVISSHGAGDAFVGALCAKLAADGGLEESLNYASGAAALHVATAVDERNKIGSEAVADFLKASG